MHRGYIKIWRKVKDSGLYQLPETFTLFMFILTECTHQPRRIGSTLLQRGQYSSGRIELSRQLKQSEQTVRTGLDRLKKLEIITIETTSHGSIYTIVNYELYQQSDSLPNQPNNQPLTSEQPAANQPLTSEQPHNKHINTKHISTEEKNKYIPPIGAELLQDWLKVRKKKRAGDVTERVFKGLQREAFEAGLTDEQAVTVCCERTWQTFMAEWYLKKPNPAWQNVQEARLDVARQIWGNKNGTDRQIIDITPTGSDSRDGARIPETIAGVWESDEREVAGD